MTGRAAALALVAALLVSGCAVARLPETAATREQTATQHRLDVADGKAKVGYRHNYNGDDSPLANAIRNVFVLGTSGAAVGGFMTGLPTSQLSPATEGLLAGGIAGGAISADRGLGGRSRFEREWIAGMESRGYRIVATPRAIH
jgi:outer membrane lipoprotein SlyB